MSLEKVFGVFSIVNSSTCKLGLAMLIAVFLVFNHGCTTSDELRQFGTAESESVSLQVQLTPFYTATVTPTATSTITPSPTVTLTPTPMPRLHVVKEGEELLVIAMRYGITLESLLAANPGVNPQILIVGSELVIPEPGQQVHFSTPVTLLPTPVPLSLSDFNCLTSADGGAWCFLLVGNSHDRSVESISVRIQIIDGLGVSYSREAAAPLNRLPPDAALPLGIYFPAPYDESVKSPIRQPIVDGAELLTALFLPPDDERYLPVSIRNLRTEILSQGSSAEISGELFLESAGGEAAHIRVLAVAYDENREIIGFRRREIKDLLVVGEQLPFAVRVYSAGGIIDHVELMVEAVQ